MSARRIVLAALLLALVPLGAQAASASWWNNDWQYRKEVDFDLSPTGAGVAASVTDVPVLVRLSLANFSYFNDVKADGSDLRVIAGDDKTPLKFHLERFDSQNQMAFLWIDVPQLTGGAKSDKLYIYYGNSNAPAASDPAGTFDPNQALVLEFNQASGLPQDASAYKNNPTASTATLQPASLIAGGVSFSGAQSITIPASPSLRLTPAQGLTASAWVKPNGPQSEAYVMSLAEGANELTLGINATQAFARYRGAGAPVTVTQNGQLSSGDWHQLALTIGNGQLTLYVDGVAAGQASVSLAEIGGTLTVGASNHASNFLTGDVDEVSIAKTARSADWLKAAERGEGVVAPLVIYGSDGQKASSGQGSYFVTVARNITVDGWIVILICLTMLVIALGVMLLKALYLGRVERNNAAFLRDYHRMSASGEAAVLDQKESSDEQEFEEQAPTVAALIGHLGKYGASTLYQLYHMGVAELNKRLEGQAAGAQRATVLSHQSIEAIRASMDATLTRLQQRLSSQMVLLTIAISGGPFLGLLGTVIGVMITFAAIAASGDVNVNAIAPGTAAALAATVAGLSVAIPSLFGYNWLSTRIKAINANNRVFLDEFVARLAEQYS
jgi:biopolymer transport protein ExbB